jgi:glutamate---cysteine ligase / carboxylate-amine ligase
MTEVARDRGAFLADAGANAPSAAQLRIAFDQVEPYTVGLEDEVMLLDPDSYELLPRAQEVLAVLDGDPRFKLELPASQLEIVIPASRCVGDLAIALLDARRTLASAAAAAARVGSAGVHPFSPGAGELNQLPRYRQTIDEYGAIAARQLVCAFQVHVSVGDAGRALAVYNAARSYLPLLAALAANAPFYEGRDTGLASVRPKLSELLPRQGVPPQIESWDQHAESLRWGAAAGAFPEARTWWWELRPHPAFGTLEFRVPDGQTTVGDGAAIAAVVQALVAWLGERHDAGETLRSAPTWRIEENRWSACRHGTAGTIADLETGQSRPTAEALHELIDALEPVARGLGSGRELSWARDLLGRSGGAGAQREIASSDGVGALGQWLAGRFLASPDG